MHRRILLILLAITSFLLLLETGLSAGEFYGVVRGRYHGPEPYYVGNPKRVEITQSAITFFPKGTTRSSTPLRWDDTRAYPYGYFGAQYRPYFVTHRNYTNDYSQWSLMRGY